MVKSIPLSGGVKASAYYNENDPQMAAWLRELIKEGVIAPGEVDERSIENVLPIELAGFAQCHFFAGIGTWSHALRCAGWSDNRSAWTGSCPCQPFSVAGKRAGLADERHLWPAWFHLIKQCRPDVVFGEQVAGRVGYDWLDFVHDDLEAAGYAVGALDLPACGFGAPHIRNRLFFVADAASSRQRRIRQSGAGNGRLELSHRRHGAVDELADAESLGWRGRQDDGDRRRGQCASGQAGEVEHLGDASGATNGFWRNAVWLPCRDGRYRATEGTTQSLVEPLADGAARDLGFMRIQGGDEAGFFSPLISKGRRRQMRLRGYGNAIAAPVAEAFIRAYMEVAA